MPNTQPVSSVFNVPFNQAIAPANTIEHGQFADAVNNVGRIFTPWYLTVPKQQIALSNSANQWLSSPFEQTKQLFDDHQPQIAKDADFWSALVSFSCEHNLVKEQSIINFLAARMGSAKQLMACYELSREFIGHYAQAANSIVFQANALAAQQDISVKSSFESFAQGDWTMTLAITDVDATQDDVDTNDIGVQLITESCLSALEFDLDLLPPTLAKLFLRTIRVLSAIACKVVTLDDCQITVDETQTVRPLLAQLSFEHLSQLAEDGDIDTLEDEIDAELYSAIVNCDDVDYIADAAQYVQATSSSWWTDDYDFGERPDLQTELSLILNSIDSLATLRANPLLPFDASFAANVLKTIVQIFSSLYQPTDASPWEHNSDYQIGAPTRICFGTTLEQQVHDVENNSMQQVGLSNTLRLDLTAETAGIAEVSNMALAERCLLLLNQDFNSQA
ncbi:hypothetical protein [Shewanella sp. MBTL60-007]|uniref:hypothetical protein n=1 Tax=Shewanella sp. MBTL60-007 TaxID=2815911 RepID=UPI001BBC5EF7|nr:hypothetical protein [Shewanella sp. MBTL60-007]GIU21107.1 hypothetical protein TUM3792_21640 [Shewanella sp. MBTL60-007]